MILQSKFGGPSGNGGAQRANQVFELIQNAKVKTTCIDVPIRFPRLQEISAVVKSCVRLPVAEKFDPPVSKLSNFRKVARTYYYYLNELTKFAEEESIFIEGPYFDPELVAAAKSLGLSIVAAPQNIESFVPAPPSDNSRKKPLKKLKHELATLRKVDHIFCICPEDSAVLSAFDIKSKVLPYYPPSGHFQFLQNIRKLREGSEKGIFLVLGTVFNPPTYLGICELLNLLRTFDNSLVERVHLCGFGTESIADKFKDVPVRFEGAVTNERLSELMIGCKALIAHQYPTTGSLTRVVDFQVAGIPIICNYFAARGHCDRHGVSIYRTANELQDHLMRQLEEPTFPLPPLREMEEFSDAVSAIR